MICNGGIINGRNDQQICFREHQQGTLVFQNPFPDVFVLREGEQHDDLITGMMVNELGNHHQITHQQQLFSG